MRDAPAYNDGIMELYDIVDDPDPENPDYPLKKIQQRGIGNIWYRSESVYDSTRMTFQQQDLKVTHKLRIPRWNGITANCACIIDGVQCKVFSAIPVISKLGYKETEITLVEPEQKYEVKA